MTRLARVVFQLCITFGFSVFPAVIAAQSFTVLYTFEGAPDGSYPYATMISSNGNLYGTTVTGGSGGSTGYGSVFEFSGKGKEVILHSFSATDGNIPYGSLVRDKLGNLYGTTVSGGATNNGTVFKLDPNNNETIVWSFAGGTDGANPYSGLVMDSSSSLYGTTDDGGDSNNLGTVYKVDASGNETVLHRFAGGSDGAGPLATLIMDPSGNLYGTTQDGGAQGSGTVFKVDSNGNETVLHAFAGGSDGGNPLASVLLDGQGNLYGTTNHGGTYNLGTIFKLDKTGHETILHSFGGTNDGANPNSALVHDANRNVYGTTYKGGVYGYGAIYELTSSGKERVLYSFNPENANIAVPYAGLVIDLKGNLYGTTYYGGPGSCYDGFLSGCGVIFRLAM